MSGVSVMHACFVVFPFLCVCVCCSGFKPSVGFAEQRVQSCAGIQRPHCHSQRAWRAQMAEISRVLRPGGVFVGTTFMGALAPLGEVLGEDAVRPIARVSINHTTLCHAYHTIPYMPYHGVQYVAC